MKLSVESLYPFPVLKNFTTHFSSERSSVPPAGKVYDLSWNRPTDTYIEGMYPNTRLITVLVISGCLERLMVHPRRPIKSFVLIKRNRSIYDEVPESMEC